MRKTIVETNSINLKELYSNLDSKVKSNYTYNEFLVLFHLDKNVKNLVNGGASNKLEGYLSDDKSLLVLSALINVYLKKYRNIELEDSSAVMYYSRLFGGKPFSHKNSEANYNDLVKRLADEDVNVFKKNLGNVLKTVRKRERDRVKYKNPEDFKEVAEKTLEVMKASGYVFKISEPLTELGLLEDFILYDEELKGEVNEVSPNDSDVELIVSKIYKLGNSYVEKVESKVKEEFSAEAEVAVTVLEAPVEEPKVEEAPVINIVENKVTEDVGFVQETVVEEGKLKTRPSNEYKEKSEKERIELLSEESNWEYIKKLRAFNEKLIAKDLYKIQDLEHYRLMCAVVTKVKESLEKKNNLNILFSKNDKAFELLLEIKKDNVIERFFVTPLFFVNTSKKRVYADRTKIVKSKVRSRKSEIESDCIALIRILRQLVTGRREKDRLSKEMKNPDKSRVNRFSYLMQIQQPIENQFDENGKPKYMFKNVGQNVYQSENLIVSFIKDKVGNDVVKLVSRHGGTYIVTPDYILDLNEREYLFKRPSAGAPVVHLAKHLKEERKSYRINGADYKFIMNRIIRAWDLRRRLDGYSRGFDYVRLKSIK